ncbi:alpha/beta fold hydrolase [Pseudidiomarina terrestris]|uniref:alpha/beta fold hydrolase n=1 Tax=Pseudidiomarina terrestris TaxID=2820060 RepID=UPI0026556025|nr:alpha/beta fold hydrolase [Pseudidiomarina sp. 1ASP75-5]MDN7136528.1 alpha/beta fold hydrolase [Pseudidiomarina sp. 1ASP75-5]
MHDDNKTAWQSFYDDTVMPYWYKYAEQRYLKRPHEINLCYYLVCPPDAKALVLISPGRIEGAIKYPELVWELGQQGYAVAILDHRGQGFSDRLTPNPHNGHVHHFDDFVDDFAGFVRATEQQLLEHYGTHLPLYLIAHSMGGAIAALYLARYPHEVQAAVLSSPMFGIQTGWIPHWLAVAITRTGAALNQLIAPQTPWYFPGTGDYVETPFAKNELSHSEARYQTFRAHYREHPEVQLGGPSFRWIAEALSAARRAIGEAGDIHIPVLVVQAGGDTVVDAAAQREFVCALSHPQSQVMVVADAKHEIFIESDAYREPVVNRLLSWFAGERAPQKVDPCE